MAKPFGPSRVTAIIHEHSGYLSPKTWGGFAVYPNSLRMGFSRILDSPILNLLVEGDRIMSELHIQNKESIASKIYSRTRPATFFNKISSAFLNYDPHKETILYHHMNSFTLPPAWLLKIAQRYNLKLVTSIVDFQEHEHPDFLGKEIFDKRQRNYEVTLKLASGFVTASPFLVESANKYLGINGEDITIAPLGWDHMPQLTEIKSRSIDSLVNTSKPYFLFPSKAWAHKGHFELISSLQHIQNEFVLVLVGGLDSQVKNLNYVIRETGQENNVLILGFQNEIDLYALMYNSQGLVFPSIYEGFGLPYIEAAQLETPVIAFENDSVSNLLGNSGAYLHSPGDYKSLTNSLPFTLTDSNRNSIVERAYIKTKNLTWENTARKTLEMYMRVLS